MDKLDSRKLSRLKILAWLKRTLIPAAGLVIVVAIILGIGYFYWSNPEFFRNPDMFPGVEGLQYLGVFIISAILNATIILPVSNMAVIIGFGAIPSLSPLYVGLAGGIGAGFGELTGYVAGRSGRRLLARSGVYLRIERWVRRWGWIAVFILSIFPFAFDVVGIIAGAMRMPLWKFFIACWIGRTISYVVVANLAAISWPVLVVLIVLVLVGMVIIGIKIKKAA